MRDPEIVDHSPAAEPPSLEIGGFLLIFMDSVH